MRTRRRLVDDKAAFVTSIIFLCVLSLCTGVMLFEAILDGEVYKYPVMALLAVVTGMLIFIITKYDY